MNQQQNTRAKLWGSLAMGCLILGTSGCNQLSGNSISEAIGQMGALVQARSVSLRVTDQSNSSVIFSDSSGSKTFALTAGKTYSLSVSGSNFPSNASFELNTVNTSLPNAPMQVVPIINGVAMLTPSVAGDYAFKLVVKDRSGAKLYSKDYAAGIGCANPTFTRASLHPELLQLTGSNNLYALNSASVVSAANGQGPYVCAYDLTGVGIVNTSFSDCSQVLSNQYIPYVQTRNLGIVVKDACNTAISVSSPTLVPATPPTGPNQVFISGVISNASGQAASDSRISGVNYLATNTGGYNIVSPSFGGTNFSIQSFLNYGQLSSVNFGMKIDITGIAGDFNVRSNLNGSVDVSHAVIAKVTYITDEAGDQAPTQSLTGTSCTYTNLHAVVKNPVGVPCSGSTTGGTNNHADVELYGNYSCLISNAASSAMINGEFDGYAHLVDTCEGAPGGGGGGITPIRL